MHNEVVPVGAAPLTIQSNVDFRIAEVHLNALQSCHKQRTETVCL